MCHRQNKPICDSNEQKRHSSDLKYQRPPTASFPSECSRRSDLSLHGEGQLEQGLSLAEVQNGNGAFSRAAQFGGYARCLQYFCPCLHLCDLPICPSFRDNYAKCMCTCV
jgi:hypothetical protein